MSVEKRSFRELGTLSITMSIVGVLSILVFNLFPQENTTSDELMVFNIVMVVGIVILLSIGLLVGWPLIRIDKYGVSKTLFGITKKYSWDEIQDIKVISTSIAEWMVFGNKPLGNKKISSLTFQKGVVFLLLKDDKKDVTKLIPKNKKIRY